MATADANRAETRVGCTRKKQKTTAAAAAPTPSSDAPSRTTNSIILADLPLPLIKHVFAFTAGPQCVDFRQIIPHGVFENLEIKMPELADVCRWWLELSETIENEYGSVYFPIAFHSHDPEAKRRDVQDV